MCDPIKVNTAVKIVNFTRKDIYKLGIFTIEIIEFIQKIVDYTFFSECEWESTLQKMTQSQ